MTIPYGVTRIGMVEQILTGASATKATVVRENGKEKTVKVYAFNLAADATSLSVPASIRKLIDFEAKTITLTRRDIFVIVGILSDAVSSSYNSINGIRVYVQAISKFMSSLGLPLSWTPPSGAHITQHYPRVESTKVTAYFNKARNKMVLSTPVPDSVNASTQRNSIMPNFIHSFDSSLILR
ncbi:unnamed protein product [Sphagnum tenellum]